VRKVNKIILQTITVEIIVMCLDCLGYHGTDEDGAKRIQLEGYKPSSHTEWLGSGVYFFGTYDGVVDGLEEAKSWVNYVKPFARWTIFEATISSEKFLDLVENVSHRQTFDRAREKMLALHTKSRKPPRTFRDYIIFKFIDEQFEFDYVRAFVDAARQDDYVSKVVRRPQIQI
jgi:hypothetical protein